MCLVNLCGVFWLERLGNLSTMMIGGFYLVKDRGCSCWG